MSPKPAPSNDSAREFTRKAIAAALVKNRAKLVTLLKKYGIASAGSTYTDDELITGILVANARNLRFRQELKAILVEVTPDNAQNFTGDKNFFFTGEEGMKFFYATGDAAPYASDSYNTGSSSSSSSGATSSIGGVTTSGGGVSSGVKNQTALGSYLSTNLSTILNTGLTSLSTIVTNNSNSKLADKALQIETEKTKQAALLASGNTLGGGLKPPMSTGAKIAIGVGVLTVLGVLAYFIFRKKKG